MLDTFQVADDLKKGGFTKSQADAVVLAIKAAQEDRLTKVEAQADLFDLEARLVWRFFLGLSFCVIFLLYLLLVVLGH